jgi:hypothetical protein
VRGHLEQLRPEKSWASFSTGMLVGFRSIFNRPVKNHRDRQQCRPQKSGRHRKAETGYFFSS